MPTKIHVKNIPTGYQTFISNGRHSILGDEPVHSKGTDLGFSPTDLILSSLAMCKVGTVRNVARRKGWTIGDVDAVLEQVVKRAADGKLSTHVRVAMRIEGEITQEQRDELLREADACYVHRMIKGDWFIQEAVDLPVTENTAAALDPSHNGK